MYLLKPYDNLGSDQWFYAHLNAYTAQGMSRDQALDILVPLYIHIAHKLPLMLSYPAVAHEVKALQKHADVFCLTARSGEVVERTIEQLCINNLVFKDLLIEHTLNMVSYLLAEIVKVFFLCMCSML